MNKAQKRIVWGVAHSQPYVVDDTPEQNEALIALLKSGDVQLALTSSGKEVARHFTTADQARFANPDDLNADGQKDQPNVETGLEALKPAAASESKTSKEQKQDAKTTGSAKKS